ncbi:MAG: O-methyltransferase [Pseudomonadota bacterium]
MTDAPDLFSILDHYIDDLFAPSDEALDGALRSARQNGLPEIEISRGQGKLLYLFAKLIGAKRILEIGTLGGYSTIWLARALPEDGKLTTLEYEPDFAKVAEGNLERAGLGDQAEVIVGAALDTLPRLKEQGPFDLVFLDADKINYAAYLDAVMDHVRPGSLILADNVIRKGAVLAPRADDASANGARAFNKALAADDRLEAVVVQQVGVKGHDGLAVARVK